jgi:hypothetical protein
MMFTSQTAALDFVTSGGLIHVKLRAFPHGPISGLQRHFAPCGAQKESTMRFLATVALTLMPISALAADCRVMGTPSEFGVDMTLYFAPFDGAF